LARPAALPTASSSTKPATVSAREARSRYGAPRSAA
jgi:hypothetical protein